MTKKEKREINSKLSKMIYSETQGLNVLKAIDEIESAGAAFEFPDNLLLSAVEYNQGARYFFPLKDEKFGLAVFIQRFETGNYETTMYLS